MNLSHSKIKVYSCSVAKATYSHVSKGGPCVIQDITAGLKRLAGMGNRDQACVVGAGRARPPLVLEKLVCTFACYNFLEVVGSFYMKSWGFWHQILSSWSHSGSMKPTVRQFSNMKPCTPWQQRLR